MKAPSSEDIHHINQLKTIIPAERIKSDPQSLEVYARDWTHPFEIDALSVVFPTTTQEVSAILRYCYENNIAVVPSGGRTGLAGAANAQRHELIISMEKMNRIEEIDPVNGSMLVQAGCTTQQVQQAAETQGLYFALNLASKGSCQIGGNIATNAGGTKLIRYGGMREQVLGLEVVLPQGEVLDILEPLHKNNVGYDLKHLFIGSEGSLGIITRAQLKIIPPPCDLKAILIAVQSFSDISQILIEIKKSGIWPTAFEFFSDRALELVLTYHKTLRRPFSERYQYYVLFEYEAVGEKIEAKVHEIIEKLMEQGVLADAVIAQSSAEFNELWAYRENISESIARHGHVLKNDLAVTVSRLSDFIAALDRLVQENKSDIELVLFGHIGDGNIHINYISSQSELDKVEFEKQATALETKVFGLLKDFHGSISAEHGIGLLKKAWLSLSCSEQKLKFMREIKRTFDPKNLMNPTKIFD